MATEAVFKYLQNQNRPYSANDVVQNMHKEHGKTAVQKALDQLAADKRIIEKVYGKQKVYCITQDDAENCSIDDMNAEIVKMDQESTRLLEENKKIEAEIKMKEAELKKLSAAPTTEEASQLHAELNKRIEAKKAKLEDLQGTKVAISNEEKTTILKEHENIARIYRKRKRMCTDIIDSIMEGYPKSKKVLIEELGIETDEDVGFQLKE